MTVSIPASGTNVPADSVVAFVEDKSPRGIAAAVHRMIRAEQVGPGDRLPTVRELAMALSISPGHRQRGLAGPRFGGGYPGPRASGHLRARCR
jgi:Predicted transcriptional regulators